MSCITFFGKNNLIITFVRRIYIYPSKFHLKYSLQLIYHSLDSSIHFDLERINWSEPVMYCSRKQIFKIYVGSFKDNLKNVLDKYRLQQFLHKCNQLLHSLPLSCIYVNVNENSMIGETTIYRWPWSDLEGVHLITRTRWWL